MISVSRVKIYCCSTLFILLSIVGGMAQEGRSNFTDAFREVFDDFPRVDKDLRKWDAPVVADLDQDGYPDLILNDHGLGVSICWNNKGSFEKPFDLIMGDLHGVSVGDFDFDGNLEIILSRGGGSGSNARNSKMYRVNRKREFTALDDFDPPLELMRGRTVAFFDGDRDGDLDLINFAFPSQEKKGLSENYVYKNNGDSKLVLSSSLPPSKGDGQKTLLTDFNGDQVMDIIVYGQGKVKVYEGQGDLTYVDRSDTVLPFDLDEVNGVIEIDFDNDGDFDLFFARGKEFEIGETFYNKETQTWGFFTKRGPFEFENLEVGEVIYMENFQSQWPFNDAYYIGESAYQYAFEGETHSGKNIRLVNSNALGFPDVLNEKGGIHIGYIGNNEWKLAGDTWSPTTGTIKGVKSYPEYNHPKGLQDFLLENRKGKFVNVTSKLNLNSLDHSVGVATADIDNDGTQDLIVARRGEMVFENEVLLYVNHGESGFELINKSGLATNDIGSMGMAINTIDYDLNGWVDVIVGNERGKWHLFENKLGDRRDMNYMIFEIGSSPSGKATALDAVITLTSCDGSQQKRVGATGASYSRDHSNLVHFGLGKCQSPVKIKVIWSNGEKKSMKLDHPKGSIRIGMFPD